MAVGIVATLAIIYLSVGALLFFAQRSLIYPAPQGAGPDVTGFERIAFQTEDDLTLTGGYRRGESGKPVLLFFHGNATTWQGGAEAMLPLAEQGYGVFAAEYRGYADSLGHPDEAGLYRDGRAAIAWLEKHGVAAGEIVLVGSSLGSGVAVQLATEAEVAGLALISPYSSMAQLVGEKVPWLPVGLLLRDKFTSTDKVSSLSMPVMVLHGEKDQVIPVHHADRLASLAVDGTIRKFTDAGHELAWRAEASEMLAIWLQSDVSDDRNESRP